MGADVEGGTDGDVVEGPGGDVVEGKLQGFRPLEHTTLQLRDDVDENNPGLEMAVVNCD